MITKEEILKENEIKQLSEDQIQTLIQFILDNYDEDASDNGNNAEEGNYCGNSSDSFEAGCQYADYCTMQTLAGIIGIRLPVDEN